MCSCVGLGLGLGIGFREWVPIRNIIGGAAGAHIPMRFGLQLSACLINPPPSLSKISYKYKSMLTYIPVSFLFSFIFRVQVRVKNTGV